MRGATPSRFGCRKRSARDCSYTAAGSPTYHDSTA